MSKHDRIKIDASKMKEINKNQIKETEIAKYHCTVRVGYAVAYDCVSRTMHACNNTRRSTRSNANGTRFHSKFTRSAGNLKPLLLHKCLLFL